MQNPPVNSLNYGLITQLTAAIKNLEEEKYRGMILSSSSPKVFCAGLDIKSLYKPSEEYIRTFWKAFQTMWKTLYITPLITIAAVNGHAIAGGCVVTLSCDHSIMVNAGATIGLNETALGTNPPDCVLSLAANTFGFRKAENLLKLGKLFTSEQALKLNFVDELVDSHSELLSKAEEEMDRWLKIPSLALQNTKMSLRKPMIDHLISYEEQELEERVKLFRQEDFQIILGKYIENLKKK